VTFVFHYLWDDFLKALSTYATILQIMSAFHPLLSTYGMELFKYFKNAPKYI
jgi:hypothetical protein